jgi:ABC-type Fe3+ transport system substrate-binding protein
LRFATWSGARALKPHRTIPEGAAVMSAAAANAASESSGRTKVVLKVVAEGAALIAAAVSLFAD